ncbi:hypothetical protein Patl1_19495 [Pistacia atlantica]|uniref:Uncharacterized protein n=1 Tax=Pistacia atlantica TaxID=434234 RepID=A0ACC1BZR2_9ROSI|nr:hypothetical protein Patl1_19495 [Pistacia atlantica]
MASLDEKEAGHQLSSSPVEILENENVLLEPSKELMAQNFTPIFEGWSPDSDISTIQARVRDILVFSYTQDYDVEEVPQLLYTTCNTDSKKPNQVYNDGDTVISLILSRLHRLLLLGREQKGAAAGTTENDPR